MYKAPNIIDNNGYFQMNIQLHKGGGSTTVNNSYTPSAQELEAIQLQNDIMKAYIPNMYGLNDSASKLYFQSLADTPVDFKSLLNTAQQQNTVANQGFASLSNGELNANYLKNMQDAISTGVNSTVGNVVNNLGARGVLNSSATNQALSDISKNVSDTMAQSYMSGIDQLANLYSNMANNASNGITLGAAGQEAAVKPAQTAWDMSLGLSSTNGNTLSALAGKGTSTQTTTQSGGSNGLLSGLMGIGSSLILACFTGDTEIDMADGSKKNICDVKTGDELICYDKDSDKAVIETVESVSKPSVEKTYIIVCVDDKNAKRSVQTTPTQPLLTESNEFVDVALLRLGTKLKNVGKVIEIKESGEHEIYDLKTSGKNAYYANGFVAYGMFDEV